MSDENHAKPVEILTGEELAQTEKPKRKSKDKSHTPSHKRRRELQKKLANQKRETEPDWKMIDSLRLGGWTVAELAERFGVAPQTIYGRHLRNGVAKRAAANLGRVPMDEYLAEVVREENEKLWQKRQKEHRNRAYTVAEKVLDYAADPSVPASTLLKQMQGIKFADEIGRRATGLDKAEEMNAAKVQIAFLTQSEVAASAEVVDAEHVSTEGDLS